MFPIFRFCSSTRGKNFPCVCCEEINNEVLAKCLDCNGFLCQEGVDMHKKALLKTYQLAYLVDIKSGKVDARKLKAKTPPTCSEHQGQQLWFYCETCGVLICRECTLIDHRHPQHNYVKLQNVLAEQKSKIDFFVDRATSLEKDIDRNIKEAQKAQMALEQNVKQANADIATTVQKIRTHVDTVCEKEEQRLRKQCKDIGLKSRETILKTTESLLNQKQQLQTTLGMATQVLQGGTDHDIMSLYKQLQTSFDELLGKQPEVVQPGIGDVPKLQANTKIIDEFKNIGDFKVKVEPLPMVFKVPVVVPQTIPKVSSSTWILEREFGNKDYPGKLSKAIGIATTPDGSIAITDHKGYSTPVNVYNKTGGYKFSLDKKSEFAWNVAVDSNGNFYVTTPGVNGGLISEFGPSGECISQFAIVPPAGRQIDPRSLYATSLTFDSKGCLLVGDSRNCFISFHEHTGTHIESITIPVGPHFLTTTPDNNIIVSDNDLDVYVLDCTGKPLFQIYDPRDTTQVAPSGLCCSMNGEICICSHTSPKGVYCFSSTGAYLGCLIRQVKNPRGLTLMENDEKLVVVDSKSCVKIFRRK